MFRAVKLRVCPGCPLGARGSGRGRAGHRSPIRGFHGDGYKTARREPRTPDLGTALSSGDVRTSGAGGASPDLEGLISSWHDRASLSLEALPMARLLTRGLGSSLGLDAGPGVRRVCGLNRPALIDGRVGGGGRTDRPSTREAARDVPKRTAAVSVQFRAIPPPASPTGEGSSPPPRGGGLGGGLEVHLTPPAQSSPSWFLWHGVGR